jgi:two-component system, NtrC family, sensor kinase
MNSSHPSPFTRSQSFVPPAHVPGSESDSRARILIVDDSATVRGHLVKSLHGSYDCIQAQNVSDALDQLKQHSFELVITDVLMPGLSGVELLRMVVEKYPRTAVIVVSGVDRPQRALDAVRLGAFDYLLKPCDHDVLQITVKRALEHRRLLIDALRYKADLEQRNLELARGKAELERLQAEIVHSEKMASLGKLSAGIAHEINNPVGFVSGNLELLSACVKDLVKLVAMYDDAQLPASAAVGIEAFKSEIGYDRLAEDVVGAIDDCQAGVGRVREIVQNLKTFSRLDEAEFKLTELHEGIDSTIRLLSRYFSGGNLSLIREYGNVPPIQAYSAQLNQVWMNLLANAAQAIGDQPGEVRVRTAVDAENVTVSVSDTGSGISQGDLDKIFDPFYTTKAVGEGSGLGLSIAFGIVERHNGRIEVETESGKGTKFSVILPLTAKH